MVVFLYVAVVGNAVIGRRKEKRKKNKMIIDRIGSVLL